MTDENEIDGGKSLNGIFLMHEISIYAFFYLPDKHSNDLRIKK